MHKLHFPVVTPILNTYDINNDDALSELFKRKGEELVTTARDSHSIEAKFKVLNQNYDKLINIIKNILINKQSQIEDNKDLLKLYESLINRFSHDETKESENNFTINEIINRSCFKLNENDAMEKLKGHELYIHIKKYYKLLTELALILDSTDESLDNIAYILDSGISDFQSSCSQGAYHHLNLTVTKLYNMNLSVESVISEVTNNIIYKIITNPKINQVMQPHYLKFAQEYINFMFNGGNKPKLVDSYEIDENFLEQFINHLKYYIFTDLSVPNIVGAIYTKVIDALSSINNLESYTDEIGLVVINKLKKLGIDLGPKVKIAIQALSIKENYTLMIFRSRMQALLRNGSLSFNQQNELDLIIFEFTVQHEDYQKKGFIDKKDINKICTQYLENFKEFIEHERFAGVQGINVLKSINKEDIKSVKTVDSAKYQNSMKLQSQKIIKNIFTAQTPNPIFEQLDENKFAYFIHDINLSNNKKIISISTSKDKKKYIIKFMNGDITSQIEFSKSELDNFAKETYPNEKCSIKDIIKLKIIESWYENKESVKVTKSKPTGKYTYFAKGENEIKIKSLLLSIKRDENNEDCINRRICELKIDVLFNQTRLSPSKEKIYKLISQQCTEKIQKHINCKHYYLTSENEIQNLEIDHGTNLDNLYQDLTQSKYFPMQYNLSEHGNIFYTHTNLQYTDENIYDKGFVYQDNNGTIFTFHDKGSLPPSFYRAVKQFFKSTIDSREKIIFAGYLSALGYNLVDDFGILQNNPLNNIYSKISKKYNSLARMFNEMHLNQNSNYTSKTEEELKAQAKEKTIIFFSTIIDDIVNIIFNLYATKNTKCDKLVFACKHIDKVEAGIKYLLLQKLHIHQLENNKKHSKIDMDIKKDYILFLEEQNEKRILTSLLKSKVITANDILDLAQSETSNIVANSLMHTLYNALDTDELKDIFQNKYTDINKNFFISVLDKVDFPLLKKFTKVHTASYLIKVLNSSKNPLDIHEKITIIEFIFQECKLKDKSKIIEKISKNDIDNYIRYIVENNFYSQLHKIIKYSKTHNIEHIFNLIKPEEDLHHDFMLNFMKFIIEDYKPKDEASKKIKHRIAKENKYFYILYLLKDKSEENNKRIEKIIKQDLDKKLKTHDAGIIENIFQSEHTTERDIYNAITYITNHYINQNENITHIKSLITTYREKFITHLSFCNSNGLFNIFCITLGKNPKMIRTNLESILRLNNNKFVSSLVNYVINDYKGNNKSKILNQLIKIETDKIKSNKLDITDIGRQSREVNNLTDSTRTSYKIPSHILSILGSFSFAEMTKEETLKNYTTAIYQKDLTIDFQQYSNYKNKIVLLKVLSTNNNFKKIKRSLFKPTVDELKEFFNAFKYTTEATKPINCDDFASLINYVCLMLENDDKILKAQAISSMRKIPIDYMKKYIDKISTMHNHTVFNNIDNLLHAIYRYEFDDIDKIIDKLSEHITGNDNCKDETSKSFDNTYPEYNYGPNTTKTDIIYSMLLIKEGYVNGTIYKILKARLSSNRQNPVSFQLLETFIKTIKNAEQFKDIYRDAAHYDNLNVLLLLCIKTDFENDVQNTIVKAIKNLNKQEKHTGTEALKAILNKFSIDECLDFMRKANSKLQPILAKILNNPRFYDSHKQDFVIKEEVKASDSNYALAQEFATKFSNIRFDSKINKINLITTTTKNTLISRVICNLGNVTDVVKSKSRFLSRLR